MASLLAPGAAAAQLPTDPAPGSPPLRVYELPVDAGRHDAAPRGGNGGPGTSDPGSSFRSENNFGTSAQVPGDPNADGDGDDAAGSQGGADSTDSTGSASGIDPTAALDSGETSSAQSYLLLILIAAGGALLGFTSVRYRSVD
jgi:hypothetical protein